MSGMFRSLPIPIRHVPRYLCVAESVPRKMRAKGCNELPMFFRFGPLQTPYFWSRARGFVFLTALIMAEEIPLTEFCAAVQEMFKNERLRSKYHRNDHLYRAEVDRWLENRPRISDAFFGPRSLEKFMREIVAVTMSRMEGPFHPSGQLMNLQLTEEGGEVWFQADNLEKTILTSKQHGMQLLGWWVRTQQIAQEEIGPYVERLFGFSNTLLPISPA